MNSSISTIGGGGIQRLLPRHHGLLRLVLAGTHSRQQMAEMLGYTPENVSLVVDSPLFQSELSRRRQEIEKSENIAVRDGITLARDRLNSIALAATEKLEATLLSQDEKVAMDAADKILKYAFPRNSENRGTLVQQVVVMSDEKIERLRLALTESGLRSESSVFVSSQETNAA